METEISDCDQEGACQTPELELSQTTCFVDEPEQVDSTSETDTHEDHSSAAPAGLNFQLGDAGDEDYAESQEKSIQPSHQEVQFVLQQLREIPCTPQFRLNAEIQRTVKRCWENVPGAIAYLKEAIRTWKGSSHQKPYSLLLARKEGNRSPRRLNRTRSLGSSGRDGIGL
ncbi:hypothetical protein I8751_21740 [Nostocaceae cyanobacterium CENA357]|uniref:Uncharacterized protein n=1 Tax=Atlanticothrix silvestris CENA357 TaxID=1725252 RepID=A0A8J7HGM8_9CYAN|nr:hypothetical protein [Atlanticothrix silvestris]MBH8554922.1 hypothetical protein [Atlanticothrix silvestris CENA357]